MLEAALESHKDLLGQYPNNLAADKGYYGGPEALGELCRQIPVVSIAKKGGRTAGEKARGHDPLFRHGQRFRAGVEGTISYLKRLLRLWRPIGQLVRFVIVRHPRRGTIFLTTTDTDLMPLDVMTLYGHRFKIEVGLRQATQVIGSYAYHFWMMAMPPIRRRSKNQYMHMKTDEYRQQIKRKPDAYHRYVQVACIAQGMLIHLALSCSADVWRQFRSWLRPMNPDQPPSELVVSLALRETLPDLLEDPAGDDQLRILLRCYSTQGNAVVLEETA